MTFQMYAMPEKDRADIFIKKIFEIVKDDLFPRQQSEENKSLSSYINVFKFTSSICLNLSCRSGNSPPCFFLKCFSAFEENNYKGSILKSNHIFLGRSSQEIVMISSLCQLGLLPHFRADFIFPSEKS